MTKTTPVTKKKTISKWKMTSKVKCIRNNSSNKVAATKKENHKKQMKKWGKSMKNKNKKI